MKATVIKAETGTTEWHETRASGIGGSDAAAVLGLSKYKSPYQVWLEKRGEAEPVQDNEPMLWGRVLEPVIRQQYAERTGREVRVIDGILRDDDHPFMLANLDGFTDDTDGKRLVEVKTARAATEWGEPGTDEVPQAYLIQVQHYLKVTRMPVADIAVLIGGADFRIYTVQADAELQKMIVDGEREFWAMVEQGIAPEPMTAADVARRFRQAKEGCITATAEIEKMLATLRLTREQLKLGEEEAERMAMEIKKFMGEHDTLTHLTGATLATWKQAKGAERIDTKRLKEEEPDVYERFIKVGEPTRRFLLK